MPGLDPGIHVLAGSGFPGSKTWMAGPSPTMTVMEVYCPGRFGINACSFASLM
jgi:hypothetical protein